MILGALDDAGGRGYLAIQAKSNPVAFLTLLGKVLPQTVAAAEDGVSTPWAIVVPAKVPPYETLFLTQLDAPRQSQLEGPPQTEVNVRPSNQNADGRDGEDFRRAHHARRVSGLVRISP